MFVPLGWHCNRVASPFYCRRERGHTCQGNIFSFLPLNTLSWQVLSWWGLGKGWTFTSTLSNKTWQSKLSMTDSKWTAEALWYWRRKKYIRGFIFHSHHGDIYRHHWDISELSVVTVQLQVSALAELRNDSEHWETERRWKKKKIKQASESMSIKRSSFRFISGVDSLLKERLKRLKHQRKKKFTVNKEKKLISLLKLLIYTTLYSIKVLLKYTWRENDSVKKMNQVRTSWFSESK